MFKFKSIRYKLIITIFFGCFIPYLIGGYYLENYTEQWLYEDELSDLDRMLTQVAFMVDESFIKNMEKTASLVASDDRLIENADTIRSYTHYKDATSLYEGISPGEAEIEAFFDNVRVSEDSINFIFYGTNDGAYMESPRFSPSDNYDPRIRPWYMSGVVSNDVVISEPYITKFSQEMIISFTRKVMRDGERVGVAGISVKLDTVTQNINSVSIGKSGYIVVLNDKNTILADPRHPEWRLKTLEQVGDASLSGVDFESESPTEGIIDNTAVILTPFISSYSGWKYIAIVDKAEVVGQAKTMTNILILVYSVTLFIIFLIVFRIAKRISLPILRLTDDINDLAEFRFDKETYRFTDNYTSYHDEIGVIARALSVMRENYLELSDNINGLDDEIRNIDISKTTSYQLTLSEKNPFNSFTVSVNKLLEHVHNSLNDLKATEEELVAQLEEIESQRDFINFLAYHDPLTNLPNRRKYIETLEWAVREGKEGAVILLDLDNFKGINDTLGHVFGDKVLQHISKRLSMLSAEDIFVSRFGGDEFLILCLDMPNAADIKALVKRVTAVFSERFVIDDNEVDINFSMGISRFPKDSNDVNQLIMNADLALYTVKNRGKNGYSFFKTSMTEHLLTKSGVENALREAIENEAFYIVYQPQVSIETGEVMAYEALVRMNSAEYMPDVFIPLAEENGMIIRIGRLVTRLVIEQIAKWKAMGYPVKPVAINFSVVQMHDSKYIDYIKQLLETYSISSDLVEIEITENVFIDNREVSLIFLQKLRDLGIKISIDDFGTGYSSLSYLTFLPIDKIKLDRSLNLKFLEIENIKVMDSLIQLAHSLNLVVIAEGIETFEHVRRLKIGVCDGIQGYYFSRPLLTAEVEERFNQNYRDKIGSI